MCNKKFQTNFFMVDQLGSHAFFFLTVVVISAICASSSTFKKNSLHFPSLDRVYIFSRTLPLTKLFVFVSDISNHNDKMRIFVPQMLVCFFNFLRSY